jgi:hypothetical protein
MSEKETATEVWKREHKETWNAAIEATLQICRDRDTFESILLFDRIRKLKK